MYFLFVLCLFIALSTPIGCMSIWRKCVYLCDGLSHASILSIAIASALLVDSFIVSIVVSVFVVLLIYWFEKSSDIYVSTSVVTTSAVAISLLIKYLVHNLRHLIHGNCDCCDFLNESIVHGNLESISRNEVVSALFFGLLALFFLIKNLRSIILISFNKDMAKVLGVNVTAIDFIFFISSALFINIAVKAMGLLLSSSILIFPSLISKLITKSPISMIVISAAVAIFNACISFGISSITDIPISLLFSLSNILLLFIVYFYQRYLKKA